MGTVQVVIDGVATSGPEGMTILEAAKQVGVEIPTLCYSPDFEAVGACRVCVVEVEGAKALQGACHTPIASGMVIHTHSPKVLASRRAVIELMQAAHTGICVADADCDHCDLHKLCADLQVRRTGFRVRERRNYPVEEVSPYIHRNLSKCILCRKCVQACSEIAKQHVFAVAYRGFNSKVVVDNDVPLNKEVCRDCGICIDYCPTNALFRPQTVEVQRG